MEKVTIFFNCARFINQIFFKKIVNDEASLGSGLGMYLDFTSTLHAAYNIT